MKNKAFGTYQIAEICHVTPATVGNWIEKGLLPTFTTGGGHRRVWAEDLIRFLKSHNIPLPENLKGFGHPRVLVVDDQDEVRKMIKRTLQKAFPEIEIHETGDGFEAGHKVGQLSPALVILDLRLPGIDGFKVCKMIRSDERLKHTKILAISGHNAEDSKKTALAAGADEFLGKPFDADDLRQASAQLLQR